MPASVGYFAVANLMCMFMLLIFVFSIIRGTDKQESRMLFGYNIIALAIGNGFSILWVLLTHSIVFAYINTLIYLVFFGWTASMIAASILWFLYSESLQKNDTFTVRKNRLLLAIPGIFILIVAMTTSRTRLFIHAVINKATPFVVINRGPFLVLLTIVAYAYPVATSVKALVTSVEIENPTEKKLTYLTAAYPIIPLAAGIFQFIYRDYPIWCFFCVAGVLVTFISAQSGKISNDPLTRLNNRNELNNYAIRSIKDKEINSDLWLILFDLDKFKPINDIYGHVEGDQALIKMADILRSACKSSQMHRNFIARFGGDEFVIITSAEAERDRIIEQVRNLMDEENETSGKPYKILSSVGYAKYESTMGGFAGWMKAADERMYADKEERKKAGIA
ncbi:MAG: GGDEF domain-containing protein [Lachnospiraceae bacterium]|nr:GGDEF domain-containing protein [Lachnospiraceae bacterium]